MTTTAPAPPAAASPAPAAPGGVDSGALVVAPPGHVRPDARTEAWRFTPLERLGVLLDPPTGGAALDLDVDLGAELPAGVTREELSSDDAAVLCAPGPRDAVAAFAAGHVRGVTALRVAAGAVPAEPVVVRLRADAPEAPARAHLLLEVGAGADATVLLDTGVGSVGAVRSAALVSVVVGDGARLRLLQVHDWAAGAVHVAQVSTRLGRDATLIGVTLLLGGDLLRVSETVEFGAPGGSATLTGAWLTSDGQHHESRLSVDHAVPHCRSRVASRGALQGASAHSVWVGDVLIRAAAVGTDTYELNRNLVLTDGARADSVPNLEIETGEVTGAGHASATGRFDDEQLFYLMARGITADAARRLVVSGFFAEALDAVAAVAPERGAQLSAQIDAAVGRTA